MSGFVGLAGMFIPGMSMPGCASISAGIATEPLGWMCANTEASLATISACAAMPMYGSSRAGVPDAIGEALGWRATTTLEEGLRKTWSWIAAQD